MKVIYKKVFRELLIYKNRTILTLLGIIIGVFSIGFVLNSYAILNREMDKNFMSTNPASIIMKVSNLDKAGVKLVQQYDEALDIEVRKCVQARINRDNGTYGTIYLYAVEDFNALKIDTFVLEKGKFPSEALEMTIERDSLCLLPNVNDCEEEVFIKVPGCLEQKVKICGKVHAPGLSPASMEKYSYGFMLLEGLKTLGDSSWYDEIHIVSEADRFNRDKLKEKAEILQRLLTESGYKVSEIKVPEPGKHPHHEQLESFIFLLEAFTVMALLIACMIVGNLFSAIMNTQKKQLAIMKATGASSWDMAKPYLMEALLMSTVAEIIALPLAFGVGSGYAKFAATTLNFNITSYSVPIWILIVQILLGLGVPLLAAFYPIWKNAKLTVKEGLNDEVQNQNVNKKTNERINRKAKESGTIKITRKVHKQQKLKKWLGTEVKVPFRNLFRKKGRTILAVIALAAGGTIFMTAQNIVSSISKTVTKSSDTFSYTYDVKLKGDYSELDFNEILASVPEVSDVKGYVSSKGILEQQEIQTAAYTVKAVSEGMPIYSILQEAKKCGIACPIVVSQGLMEEEKGLSVEKSVIIKIGEQKVEATIVDVVKEIPPLPYMYVTLEDFGKNFIEEKGSQNLLIYMKQMKKLTSEQQLKTTAQIENELRNANIEVAENWNVRQLRQALADHLKIIINFLAVISVLAIVVGGMSMASIIGISISERKREIGIFRAIGASDYKISKMITIEVCMEGFLGWLMGCVLAYPTSIVTGNYFGQIFLHSNLQNTISAKGIIIWFILSLAVALLSGWIPSNNACLQKLREMLAYE